MRQRLATFAVTFRNAIDQLPTSGRGVIHVGLETPDGEYVEAERFGRIISTVTAFDAKGKDLRWVYIHLYESYSPPDTSWFFDETIYKFGATQADNPEPISRPCTVVSDDGGPGMHWMRDAP